MIIYLSSVLESSHLPMNSTKEEYHALLKDTHILTSFAYNKQEHEELFPLAKSILVDSGAFTIMSQSIKKGNRNFDVREYTKKYADFIKEHNFDNFIEMDIEGAYGFDVYIDCLHMLQDITGKEPIYVYHKWRGLEYYKQLVRKHKYVCLGDVDVSTRNMAQEAFFKWFIDEAHANDCRVHGLAFTKTKELGYLDFDSVDSSSWTAGVRFASCSKFNGHDLNKYSLRRTATHEMVHYAEVAKHDFLEWKKFQQYMDTEYEPEWLM